MRILMPEVVAGLESENVGRLTAMWTVVAFERADGNVEHALEIADGLGCRAGVEAVVRHVEKLPEGQRGFVVGGARLNGKRTPGPWYVAGEQSGVTEYNAMRHVYAQSDKDAGGTGCVADVASSTANAALIAAAPDMLEALLALTRHVQECHEFWRAEGFPRGTKEHGLAVCLNNRAGELIAAAIDKATGSDGGAR